MGHAACMYGIMWDCRCPLMKQHDILRRGILWDAGMHSAAVGMQSADGNCKQVIMFLGMQLMTHQIGHRPPISIFPQLAYKGITHVSYLEDL